MTERLKEHYRPDELARALDVKPRCIYRWIRAGLVRYIHAGKHIRIPQQEYLRLLRDGVPINGPACRK
jgi:excisionase family DNA binding protein